MPLSNIKGNALGGGIKYILRVEKNWRTPWKNRICSITMKVRKSLIKPVTWQKTCNYIKLFSSSAKIVMQDTFNVILWMSADICVVHDDLGWKNWTTPYNGRCSSLLRVVVSEMTYTVSSGTLNSTIPYLIIALFLPRHWLYAWFLWVEQPNNMLQLQVLESWLQSIRIHRHSLSMLTE